MFDPPSNKLQSADFVMLKKWFEPGEALRIATYNNARLLALSGPRKPYPGKLGVIEKDAYADIILVKGDPTANFDLIGEPDKNFQNIMKGGRIYKNAM